MSQPGPAFREPSALERVFKPPQAFAAIAERYPDFELLPSNDTEDRR